MRAKRRGRHGIDGSVEGTLYPSDQGAALALIWHSLNYSVGGSVDKLYKKMRPRGIYIYIGRFLTPAFQKSNDFFLFFLWPNVWTSLIRREMCTCAYLWVGSCTTNIYINQRWNYHDSCSLTFCMRLSLTIRMHFPTANRLINLSLNISFIWFEYVICHSRVQLVCFQLYTSIRWHRCTQQIVISFINEVLTLSQIV